MISELMDLKRNTFFPTLVIGERINQGNAVITRFLLRHVKNHALPGIGEPRFLSEAQVRIDDLDVRIFVTHLSLELKIRTPQIHHIAEIIGRHEAPTILAGDFNIAHEAELTLLTESNLVKATSAATFPSWKPTKYLDYLFFSQDFRVAESHTFNGMRFSDHLPFIAAVELPG